MGDYIEAFKEYQKVLSSKRRGKLDATIQHSKDLLSFKTGSRNVQIMLPLYEEYNKLRDSHVKVLKGLYDSRSRVQSELLYGSDGDLRHLNEINVQIKSLEDGLAEVMKNQYGQLEDRRGHEWQCNEDLSRTQMAIDAVASATDDDRRLYNYVKTVHDQDLFEKQRKFIEAQRSFNNDVYIGIRDASLSAYGVSENGSKKSKKPKEPKESKEPKETKETKEPLPDNRALRKAYNAIVKQTQDDKLVLYNNLSDDYDAGDGPNEHVENSALYKNLNAIKKWRTMLTYAHECLFKYDEATYLTIQHAFMAQKAKLAGHESYGVFAVESNSNVSKGSHDDARELGATVKLNAEQKEQWRDQRDELLTNIFMAKLEQCPQAASALMETYGAELWMNVDKSGLGRFDFLEDIREKFVKVAIKSGFWTNSTKLPSPPKQIAKKKLIETLLKDNGFKFENAEQCATAKRSLAHYMSKDDIISVIESKKHIAEKMPKGYKSYSKDKICDVLIENLKV